MPLKRGSSDATRSENIREMVRSGHDPRQAAAAAYRQQRESGRKGKRGKRKSRRSARRSRRY
jgi:hypothetical protein